MFVCYQNLTHCISSFLFFVFNDLFFKQDFKIDSRPLAHGGVKQVFLGHLREEKFAVVQLHAPDYYRHRNATISRLKTPRINTNNTNNDEKNPNKPVNVSKNNNADVPYHILSFYSDVDYLQKWHGRPRIVELKGVRLARPVEEKSEDYDYQVQFVLEYCPSNLHRLLHEETRITALSDTNTMQGDPLAPRSSSASSTSAQEKVRILLQICEFLVMLHEDYFVYGDLKPKNVLLSASNEVKFSDFGGMVSVYGKTGRVFEFTPQYAAPECLQPDKKLVRLSLHPSLLFF